MPFSGSTTTCRHLALVLARNIIPNLRGERHFYLFCSLTHRRRVLRRIRVQVLYHAATVRLVVEEIELSHRHRCCVLPEVSGSHQRVIVANGQVEVFPLKRALFERFPPYSTSWGPLTNFLWRFHVVSYMRPDLHNYFLLWQNQNKTHKIFCFGMIF